MSPQRLQATEIVRIQQLLVQVSTAEDLPYDVRWAFHTLQQEELDPPEVLRFEVVQALTEELVARRETAILTRLAQQPHKIVAKAARAGLHRLRSQKVMVDIPRETAPDPAPPIQLAETTKLQALITGYDHRLQRAILLPQEAVKGLILHQARVSAEHGLLDFASWSSSRKKFKQIKRTISDQLIIVSIEAHLARWFIDQAVRISQELRRGVPEEYARACQSLGPVPTIEHPALALDPAAAGPQNLLALYEKKELSLWFPEQELLRQLALKIEEATTSRLMIDDRQRGEQIKAIIDRFTSEHFTPARCAVTRRFLLDTAHLMAAAQHRRDAELARAAADLFEKPTDQVIAHPFTRHFIERVVRKTIDSANMSSTPEEQDERGDERENQIIVP